ncbi:MAG: molybdopterin-guanine dinucleotide biosynthesis protein B [Pseudomonadota bacterium]
MRVFGVVGWKNQGKTTLVERLIPELAGRGLRVSTVKHAHHAAELDMPGRDSHRHRTAGAAEVLLASAARVAVIEELRGAPGPPLPALLRRLQPADLVLIEGFKTAPHPKLEVFRAAACAHAPYALSDASVRFLVGDAGPHAVPVPVLPDDIAAIANAVLDAAAPLP